MKFPTTALYLESAKICLKDWKRFLLACVFNVIPIVNFIAIGYVLETMRLFSKEPDSQRLPEWKSIGQLFVTGAKLVLVCMAWLLPILVVIMIGYFLPDLIMVVMVLAVIVGGLVYYLIPSILIHESQGFGKSFGKSTFRFSMTGNYLKQVMLVSVVNVPFAMLGQVVELTLVFSMTLLLLCMSRGFAKAYTAYTK